MDTIGSGLWYNLHTQAKYVDDDESLAIFRISFEQMLMSLPCPKCRKHSTNYYDKNYLDSSKLNTYMYNGYDLSIFKWTVDFHNNVNFRLNKSLMSVNTAINVYIEPYLNPEIFELKSEDCESCNL